MARTDPQGKIALVASAGGHLSQLLMLRDAWAERAHFYITTRRAEVGTFEGDAPFYRVTEAGRQWPGRVMRSALECARILREERPDVIISTGAATGCIACALGKMMGARVVWIDSIANVDRLSLAGRIALRFADLFLTQWPELARAHQRASYSGAVV